jgi:YidC/Oxa1 family membrane protein insertase
MEKRVLLAVTLSFLVLFAYQSLVVPPAPEPQPAPAQTAPMDATRPATVAEPPAAPGAVPAQPAAPATPEVATATEVRVADATERQVEVHTPEVRGVFTNRGAELVRWELRQFLTEQGAPVDLVPANLPADAPRTFGLRFDDPVLTARVRQALFRPSAERIDVAAGERELVFDYEEAGGLAVRKAFVFRADEHPYLIRFTATATQEGQPLPFSVVAGPGLGDIDRPQGGGFLVPIYHQRPQGIFNRDGDVTRVSFADLRAQPVHEGRFHYIGADDQYFLGVLLPNDRQVRVTYQPFSDMTPLGPRELVGFEARLEGGAAENLRVVLGPKQFDLLAEVDRELVRTIHFGIVAPLAVPLLHALNWVHGYIGNYGWSIIILTIIINALMFPLRHKSVVSMRKMQELQPEMKAIQERYKGLKTTDPARQKMNVEMMNLYREKGVNPASGCVPMLLTFPVLFAFYALLSQAIEIRNAPFVGWITDLSAHDPYYVTPILMGASMVLQMRMTPTSADPMQQKIMMFMPIMFTFMFLWAPSGLVIYWFCSNLWAIGQQYVTNRIIGPPKVARPPAERRLKKASGAA